MNCKQCGTELNRWSRSDKKFCSATCRKAWSRRADGAKRSLKNIMRDLQTVRLTIKKHPDLKTNFNDDLKRLRDEITDILRLSDSETIEEEAQKAEVVARTNRNSKGWLTPQQARRLSSNYTE